MKKIVGFLLLLLLSGGCLNKLDNPEPVDGLPRSLTAAEEELILSGTRFSYDLFRRLNNATNQENLVVSPFALYNALGLPLNGAFGETRDGIQAMLLLDGMTMEEINEAGESLGGLIRGLDSNIDTQFATSLWHRDNLTVKEEFAETSGMYFDADVRELDLEDSDTAVDIINEWVRERTGERISQIVSTVPQFMILYLVNAAYYQGEWSHGFDSDLTRQKSFYSEQGDTLEVEMMEREAEIAAYISEEVEMVDTPFGEGYFTMTLLVPGDPEQSIREFISEYLREDRLAEWLSELSTRGTLLQLPKFELEGEYNLRRILEDMDMRDAFERSADFYNISEDDRVYLSDVRHKAVVRIDERGKGKLRKSTSERAVWFNRPFVFLIREQHSGVILLMGKVGNPVDGVVNEQ